MREIVDARGLPCPKPVLLTRRALQESQSVTTIVDNESAQHNVTRMAEGAGCTVEAQERHDGIYLHITRGEPAEQRAAPGRGPLVVVIPSEFMGRGEYEELGQLLIRGFFHALGEAEPMPDSIIFLNSGVKLVVEGSPVVEDLQAMGQRGTEILACGTCLGYYGLTETIAVGEVSNMYTIVETMLRAGKVVSL